jgi:UPF0755 protein
LTDIQTPPETEFDPYPAEPRRRSALGVIVGLALAGAVIYGLFAFGTRAADFLSGLGGAPDELTAPEVPAGQPVSVNIPEGASARTIAEVLTNAAVVGSTLDFELSVRAESAENLLKAGEYEFETGMAPSAVIDVLIEGPNVETFRLTLREGLRIGEVLDELASQTDFTAAQYEAALLSGEVVSAFVEADADALQAWEGALFPDTYEFFADATEAEILQRLVDQLERNIGTLDWTYVRQRGLSLYEGLIMASMVEAETRVDGDRSQVASVLYNRTEIGMALQIDATVLYALGERGIGLTLADLEFDSPYNTYVNPGLPPTPIGTVGIASLRAIADPEESDYLYYVLTSTDGSHSFTADYDEFLNLKNQAKEDGVIP